MAAFVAIALGIAGIGFRLWLIWQGVPVTNSDEAAAGLAAWHIAQGRELPVFFYGQYYLGALYSYLAAPFFLLFGPSVLVQRLPALLLYAGFLIVMYHLVKRLYTRWFAVFSTGLFSLGADRVLRNELIGGGQYPESLFCTALLFLLTLYGGTHRALHFGSWGLLAGVMLWSSWNTLPYLAVAFVLLLIRYRSHGWRWIVLLLGAVIGSAPLILHNLTAPPAQTSLHVLQILATAGPEAPLTDRLTGGVLFGLPLTFGLCEPSLCHPWQLAWTPILLTLLLVATLPSLTRLSRLRLSRLRLSRLRLSRLRLSRLRLSRLRLSRLRLSRPLLGRFRLARLRLARFRLERFRLARSQRSAASPIQGRLEFGMPIFNLDPQPDSGDQTAFGSPNSGCGSAPKIGIPKGRSESRVDGRWVRAGLGLAGLVTLVLYVRSPASAETPLESARYLHLLLISLPVLLWPLWRARTIGRAAGAEPGRARGSGGTGLVGRNTAPSSQRVAVERVAAAGQGAAAKRGAAVGKGAAAGRPAVAARDGVAERGVGAGVGAWVRRGVVRGWRVGVGGLLVGVVGTMGWATGHVAWGDRVKSQEQQQVLGVLRERGVTEYYGDYWACMWGSLGTLEEIVCSVLNDELGPGFDRYEPHRERVARVRPEVYVATAHSAFESAVRRKLAGTGYVLVELGSYRVYDGRYGMGREGLDSS